MQEIMTSFRDPQDDNSAAETQFKKTHLALHDMLEQYE